MGYPAPPKPHASLVLHVRARLTATAAEAAAEVDELRLFCRRIEHHVVLGVDRWRLELLEPFVTAVPAKLYYLVFDDLFGIHRERERGRIK